MHHLQLLLVVICDEKCLLTSVKKKLTGHREPAVTEVTNMGTFSFLLSFTVIILPGIL